jgi:LDH2 family malate/lactate/ureidoglycolate dehydrogenase
LPGWVTDKEGIPIMEEKPVFDRDEYHQAPLGGTREQGSHKGYGFAMMAEVLSTGALGAPCRRCSPPAAGRRTTSPRTTSRRSRIRSSSRTRWTGCSRRSERRHPQPGQERVLYPGLSEAEELQHRRAHGIPLHKEVIQWFGVCTSEMGLEPLAVLR